MFTGVFRLYASLTARKDLLQDSEYSKKIGGGTARKGPIGSGFPLVGDDAGLKPGVLSQRLH
ncbi:hypothetical protein [Terrilactibacillus laevilacticus]|uniref:hypothetical protein n=1 Tax=Terrilactibacillus laevilacticus TaxID=1380157 RepID=UPI0036DEABF9